MNKGLIVDAFSLRSTDIKIENIYKSIYSNNFHKLNSLILEFDMNESNNQSSIELYIIFLYCEIFVKRLYLDFYKNDSIELSRIDETFHQKMDAKLKSYNHNFINVINDIDLKKISNSKVIEFLELLRDEMEEYVDNNGLYYAKLRYGLGMYKKSILYKSDEYKVKWVIGYAKKLHKIRLFE